MTTPIDFVNMDRVTRERLLEGPTLTLTVTYGGNPVSHSRQLTAGRNIVARDRNRQLVEQAQEVSGGKTSAERRIEFPLRALEAASPAIAEYVCLEVGNPSNMLINAGDMLPGYVMEVLDWYARALYSQVWTEFLPHDASIEEDDIYFWMYVYITMRLLGMHCFAESLGPFVADLVYNHKLADDAWALQTLLYGLSPRDPLLQDVAQRYVELENEGNSPLCTEDWVAIYEHYTEFALRITELRGLVDAIDTKTTEYVADDTLANSSMDEIRIKNSSDGSGKDSTDGGPSDDEDDYHQTDDEVHVDLVNPVVDSLMDDYVDDLARSFVRMSAMNNDEDSAGLVMKEVEERWERTGTGNSIKEDMEL